MNKDRLSQAERSRNMSRIRGKDTKPEKIVRSALHRAGYRFRLHVRIPLEVKRAAHGSSARSSAVARPDLILPKYRIAIFVHGCFWHRHKGCKNCTTPTHRREWWLAKLNGNTARDKLNQRALRKLGWRVIVVWECQTKSSQKLIRALRDIWLPSQIRP